MVSVTYQNKPIYSFQKDYDEWQTLPIEATKQTSPIEATKGLKTLPLEVTEKEQLPKPVVAPTGPS